MAVSAEELKLAISVLPELSERKKIIDSHLQIATSLLEQIKQRNLGDLFQFEQQLAELSPFKLLESISNKGNQMDRLRILLLYYLERPELSEKDISLVEKAINECGEVAIQALTFCKQLRSFNRLLLSSRQSAPVTTPSSPKSTSDLLRLTSGVLGNVLSSVKNLLPENGADTPLAKMVDAALELAMGAPVASGGGDAVSAALRSITVATSTSSPSTEKPDLFTLFDPKNKNPGPLPAIPPQQAQRAAFNHLIVFVVGGSNYLEYNHLEEYIRKRNRHLKLQLTFGSTALLTAEQFLAQLK